jgi:hypothetical protein
MNFEDLFNLEQAKKTNILVSGSNASGKTLLTCGIASMLHKLGYQVLVFDVSGAWKKKSDLPYFSRVILNRDYIYGNYREQSGIIDMSLLKMRQAKQVVERETERIWLERANRTLFNDPIWLIFEEAEMYLKNIRGRTSENVYRIVHMGRNLGIRAILVTTDLSLIDASVIRLCDIRFHGSLGIEENAKRKFRAYYGKDWCNIATEKLPVGNFIRLQNKALDVVQVEEFKRKNCPKIFFNFLEEQEQQEEQLKPEPQIKPSLFARLRNIF